jgi:glyoxylase-like metal-dependent hydrolase (beta-lactamase superfamily II)
MPRVRAVHAFHTGIFRDPSLFNTRGTGWRRVDVPVLCFAVETDAGAVVVDAGFGSRGPRSMGLVRSTLFRALAGLRFEPGWGLADRLDALGAGRVAAFFITHLDIDHTGGLREAFLRAGSPAPRVLVGEAEWREARAPGLLERRLGRNQPLDYADGLPVETLAFTKAAARDLRPLEAANDIFGDGSVVAVSLPGHSAGHAGLLVRAGDARVLLCGDAAFAAEHVTAAAMPGLFPMNVAHDRAQMLDTLERLRAFARERKDVRVVPSHDPEVGRLARDGPIVLAGARAAAGAAAVA